MAVQVNTHVGFILDGNETNAGERVFVRDTKGYIIDGDEAGTAAQRQYLRNVSAVAIEGRSPVDLRLTQISAAVIEELAPNRLHASLTSAFTIIGRPRDRIFLAAPACFIIETE